MGVFTDNPIQYISCGIPLLDARLFLHSVHNAPAPFRPHLTRASRARPQAPAPDFNGAAPAAKLAFDDISADGKTLNVPADLNTGLFPHPYAAGARSALSLSPPTPPLFVPPSLRLSYPPLPPLRLSLSLSLALSLIPKVYELSDIYIYI
jgi:hypothetical protein